MQLFTDWLKNDAKDCGLCDPPIEPQLALNFLIDYLLGEDWYVTMPECTQQTNTAAVYAILFKYSKKFRKEVKKMSKIEDVRIESSHEVTLKVYPVCECGEVIKDLVIEHNQIYPNICPRCHKHIKELQFKYPDNNNYVDFEYESVLCREIYRLV